jgi:predicted nucleic acid-binding protein
MSGNAFLDTNIFIYSLDRIDARKEKIAMRIIREAASTGNGIISFQVVQEFFNVAFKRFPKTMTPEDGTAYLLTVLRPFLAVQSSVALYSSALAIRARYQLSWYDSLIIAAASEASCSVIYTEDLHHGAKINGVRIENPFRITASS